MAKGRKTGGRDVVKGQVLNPKGRPPMSAERKLVRDLTREQLAELGKLIIERNYDELEAIASSKQSNILMMMIASALCRSARTGNWDDCEALITRIVGKPKEEPIDINIQGFQAFVDIIGQAAAKRRGTIESK